MLQNGIRLNANQGKQSLKTVQRQRADMVSNKCDDKMEGAFKEKMKIYSSW